jgi:hypothetical protein
MDGEIYASKLSFYRATVIQARYSNKTESWYPQVFGEGWNLISWWNPFVHPNNTMNTLFSEQETVDVRDDPGTMDE